MDAQTQALIDRLDAAGLWAKLSREFYAEGTYTPTYQGGTTPGTTTYISQIGEYTRIGGVAHVWGAVTWSAATGTGDGRISLPFTARATMGGQYPVAIRVNGLAFTGDWLEGVINQNTSFLIIQAVTGPGGAAVTVPVDAGGGVIAFSATYPIAT